MSTAKVLKADNYRWWTRDGKCCRVCKNVMHTIIKGKHLHWCQVHLVEEFPHVRWARIAPWMLCDKFKKGGHQ